MEGSLDRVNHVAVAVEDIGRAVEWYMSNFACNILYRDDTWAYLEFDNVKLALVLPEQHAGHVAYEVDRPERFGTVKIHRDGVRYVYFTDSEGNTVEAVDRKTANPERNVPDKGSGICIYAQRIIHLGK